MSDLALVDRIYEAAVLPEFWPEVLQDITRHTEAAFASLVTFDGTVLRWTGTPEAIQLIDAYKAVEAVAPNIRIPKVMERRHAGFLTDQEILSANDIDTHPFYTDFMRPRGYGWVAGTVVEVPSGDTLVFGVERHFKRGPVERGYIDWLDALRPHLARSGLLSSRLGLERARAMTDALAILGLPGAVIRRNGAMLACNVHFEELIPETFRDTRARLALVEVVPDGLLAKAMSWHDGPTQPVRAIPIGARDDRPAMVVHLIPIRRAANDIFPNSLSIVLVTKVVPQAVANAEVLQSLFDLTPAEARIARLIGEGRSTGRIAAELGYSRESVRSWSKSIMSKTGMHSRAAIANLLGAVQSPRL